jgi:hypothetical protein
MYHFTYARYWNFLTRESRYSQFRDTPQGDEIRRSVMEKYHEHTKATAPESYWVLFLPDYETGCKRVIGDFGYLASLNAPNLKLLHDSVVQCEESGVVIQSGKHYTVNALVHHSSSFGRDHADRRLGVCDRMPVPVPPPQHHGPRRTPPEREVGQRR